MLTVSWRSPLFWPIFAVLSGLGIWFSIHYFDKTFPMINLNISMDRNAAINDSLAIAREHNWFADSPQAAAMFSVNSMLQYYIELEAGGVQAFTKLIEENIYAPYQWQVRLFKEQTIEEAKILFKPDGTPFGFSFTMPEHQTGAALSEDEARAIALKELSHWPFNIRDFNPVEHAEKKLPHGRIDHTFAYELRDKKIGESPYRLQMRVQGDRVTQFELSIKTPESFDRNYMAMRSKNDTIARIAFMFVYIFYFIGGVIGGLIYIVYRRRKLWWRPALLWAGIISILSFAALLNQIPLIWMQYQTATSAHAFLGKFFLDCFQNLFYNLGVTSLIIAATEGLTTIAFPNHIHLWHNWYKNARVSLPVLGQTIGAYLLLGYKFAYVIAFYLLAIKYFGWWTPSETLADPNILASYFAWIKPIANALYAGFIEECLFRAIPLSCALIIGRWLGRERLCLIIAFIAQALIFSAAHANYASQPAYSRVIELIIPSFMYGGVFLLFGLLPGIIAHVVYDVILMAIPIWVNHAPGSLLDKIIIILFASIPMLIIALQYLKERSVGLLDERYYNRAMNTMVTGSRTYKELPVISRLYSPHSPYAIAILGALSLAVWIHFTPFHADQKSISLSRNQAIEKAKEHLPILKNTTIWKAATRLTDTSEPILKDEKIKEQHYFTWQTKGKEYYHSLLGTYLNPLQWLVRFTKHQGSLTEKAEEYIALLNHNGTITRFYHQKPESAPAPTITKQAAELLIKQALPDNYHTLEEIAASNIKKPQRNEWKITYKTKDADSNFEKRISAIVSGNEITDLNHYIHVPETWERRYINTKAIHKIFESGIALFTLLILAFLALYLFYRTAYSYALMPALSIILFFILRMVIMLVLQYPTMVSIFKTAEPMSNQFFAIFSSSAIKTIFKALIYSTIIGLFYRIPWRSPQLYQSLKSKLIIGGTAGIIMGSMESLIKYYSPALKPFWLDTVLGGSFFPSISLALQNLTTYVEYTIIMLAVLTCIDYFTNAWHQHRLLTVPLFITFGLCTSITTTQAWIMGGSLAGLGLLFVYLELLRFSKASIPFAAAVYLALQAVQYASINPYPGAQEGALITIITLLALGILSAQFLLKKRA